MFSKGVILIRLGFGPKAAAHLPDMTLNAQSCSFHGKPHKLPSALAAAELIR